MRFTMRFDMDNAAFEDMPEQEVARILTRVAGDVQDYETSGVCIDFNGNRVGGWEIIDD